ncbi:lysosomal alpha-mannosidase-like [Lycorma delicatula]|uniref:lysosomal alpha-mannosidase-like n=1 Tax=Lycorma delicatula TaxID=130591 RepID=UPI003F51346E
MNLLVEESPFILKVNCKEVNCNGILIVTEKSKSFNLEEVNENQSKSKVKREKSGVFDEYNNELICGYETCPEIKKEMLNVHLVPHSHLDLGWLKTVNEYYYGFKADESDDQHLQYSPLQPNVKTIIDEVIKEVDKDSSRRFIFAETAYLWKWWKENNESERNELRKLVQTGQIEIVGGGWSMNDEAVTHYQPIIDQFTWGFRKLKKMFGNCGIPKVAWQIDPFGHSRGMASIIASLGFDGLFLGRVDYEDKHRRIINRNMEMIWQGSPHNLGTAANLFTSILYDGYLSPPMLCTESWCNTFSGDNNTQSTSEMIRNFIHYIKTASVSYSTKNLLIPIGNDFAFSNGFSWFNNMDKLIWQINRKQDFGLKVNVLYSTPSCYLKTVQEQKTAYETKSDDFFPYASDKTAYWTGFYTSKPSLKLYERKANNFLQYNVLVTIPRNRLSVLLGEPDMVCNQLCVLSDLDERDQANIESLRSALGIMQHHDAITGTAATHVSSNYAEMLSKGISKCQKVTNKAIRRLIFRPDRTKLKQKIHTVICPLLNISRCGVTEENMTFVVTVYNPLSSKVSYFVRFPIPGKKPSDYEVINSAGDKVKTQIIPIPTCVRDIPGRDSKNRYELLFEAVDIPPLGFISFYVTSENVEEKTPVTLGMKVRKSATIGFKEYGIQYNIIIITIFDVHFNFENLQ